MLLVSLGRGIGHDFHGIDKFGAVDGYDTVDAREGPCVLEILGVEAGIVNGEVNAEVISASLRTACQREYENRHKHHKELENQRESLMIMHFN